MTFVAWVLKRIEKTGMQALAAEQIKGARRLYILAYNLEKGVLEDLNLCSI
jgi:hypothetical protein